MSVKIFEEEISIWVGRLSNEDSLINVGGHLPIHSRPEKNKKTEEGKEICFLRLNWDIQLFLPLDWWARVLRSQTDTYPVVAPGSVFWMWTGTMPFALLGHQLLERGSWNFSASKITWANSLWQMNLFIYLFIYLLLVCSFGNLSYILVIK